MIYANHPHFDYGSSMFGLFKTDNNTSMVVVTSEHSFSLGTVQLLIGGSGDGTNLPRIASDVVPFLSELRGHAVVPSWVFKTIAMLCESGNPCFDNIKIRVYHISGLIAVDQINQPRNLTSNTTWSRQGTFLPITLRSVMQIFN